MSYVKNTASKRRVFAYDRITGLPVLGDEANITAQMQKDFGTLSAVADTNPTEISGGYYVFDLTAAENNADQTNITPESTTADVMVIGDPPTDYAAITAAVINQEIATGQVGTNVTSMLGSISTVQGTVNALPTKEAIAIETDTRLLDAGDATDLVASIVARIGNTNVSEAGLVGLIRADNERTGGMLQLTQSSVGALNDPTTAEIAASILSNPSNLLTTSATGKVTSTNAGTGADVYDALFAISYSGEDAAVVITLLKNGMPMPGSGLTDAGDITVQDEGNYFQFISATASEGVIATTLAGGAVLALSAWIDWQITGDIDGATRTLRGVLTSAVKGITVKSLDAVGGGGGGPFLNTLVSSALTVSAGTRADGTTYDKTIRLRPGESAVAQWSYDKRAVTGDVLDAMTLPVSDDPNAVTVVNELGGEKQWGVENLNAKLTLQVPSGASPGAKSIVRSDINPEGSQVDKAVMVVEVIGADV